MRRLLVTSLILLAGCGAPLPHSQESVDDLARAVLQAIERRDVDELHALALNREEFTAHVWPELPAARPERHLSPAFVWGDLNQKSNIMLRETLLEHGGKKYQLVRVRFLGRTTPYRSYVVHRESEVTVTDTEGRERQMRLFGSVIERAGRFKVFSYVIDD